MYNLFFMKHSVKDQVTKYCHIYASTGTIKNDIQLFFWRIFFFMNGKIMVKKI